MNRRLVVAIIFALILGLVFFVIKPGSDKGPTREQISKRMAVPTPIKINQITLTSTGFTPKTITIGRGETVSWLNSSGRDATVNSDPYPKNDLFKFLNLGEFRANTTVQAIFEEVGQYGYHNHLVPAQTGVVIVK